MARSAFRLPRAISFLSCFLVLWSCSRGRAEAYDPLAVSPGFEPASLDLTVEDEERKRELPLCIYLPPGNTSAPVVLFSHGLGGDCKNNPYLGKHWAARGYVAVFLQHPGSDSAVWKDKPASERMEALQQAAGLKNFMLRAKDVTVVLDQLVTWNATQGHALQGKMDLAHVGMSGHSFGAVTTQAVSGQGIGRQGAILTDKRIQAAILFSPSSPRLGDAKRAFAKVKIPWMLMTGTNDVAIIGDIDLDSRLAVFPALPPGGKYEVVFEGAEHSAFGDRPLPGDRQKRNPNHHRAILALSTAFWDAYLREDPAAKTWLNGDGARTVLEEKDRWQKK